MRLKIALIRCGQTASEEEGRLVGKTNEPLTVSGKEKLASDAESGRYPQAALVYTGAALRCRETASILYPCVPAVVTGTLRPFDYGDFEGASEQERRVDKQFEQWAASGMMTSCPGGESPYQFSARCTRAFREIIDEMNAKGIETTAVITHASIINVIMQRYCIPRSLYRDWDVDCGGGYFIEYDSVLGSAKLLKIL